MGPIAPSPKGQHSVQGGVGATWGTEELSEQKTLGRGAAERETLGFAIRGKQKVNCK